MDFFRGWNLVPLSFSKQGKSFSSSEESNSKVEKTTVGEVRERKNIEEEVWTENDTGDIMDLMETALSNVKRKLLTKLRKNSTEYQRPEEEDVVKKEEMEVERLEDFISSVQTNTMEVVEEINSVMQIIAEVTTEDNEVDENIPEIDPSDTTVGNILSHAQDSEAKENWQRLMRKLTTKRKRSMKRKPKRNDTKFDDSENPVCMNPQVYPSLDDCSTSNVDTNDNVEEDCIPEDWKPDFIPSNNKDRAHLKNDQPDVIPVEVHEDIDDDYDDDDAEEVSSPYSETKRRMTIPQTRRSENRSAFSGFL